MNSMGTSHSVNSLWLFFMALNPANDIKTSCVLGHFWFYYMRISIRNSILLKVKWYSSSLGTNYFKNYQTIRINLQSSLINFPFGTPPPMKLKSKLLIESSLNFGQMRIESMQPTILNFKSISQFWQRWSRNRQHCGSEKYAFIKNPTPPTVFAANFWNFA